MPLLDALLAAVAIGHKNRVKYRNPAEGRYRNSIEISIEILYQYRNEGGGLKPYPMHGKIWRWSLWHWSQLHKRAAKVMGRVLSSALVRVLCGS